ncbi:MAG: hypothetical protein ACI4C4_03510 [Lachnospiraceae bacterium]
MQKAFEIEKTTTYPLGVSFQPEGMHISAVFEQTDKSGSQEKGILLYDAKYRDGIRIPFPETNKVGSIYSMLLKGYQDRTCSYLFYHGEHIFQDPYCRKIDNPYRYGEVKKELPKCKILDGNYEWEGDLPLRLPYEDMILYALHVRGFTKHRSSAIKCKGTYAGIVEKIPYLKELGITSLLLMPAYEFDEVMIQETNPQTQTMEQAVASYMRKLPAETEHAAEHKYKTNYWGYKKGLYYMPKSSYAYGKDAVTEYKDMVKALHQNNIEVLMQFYFPTDVSPLEMIHIMKFWVLEYHIDGFHVMGVNLTIELFLQEPLLAETKILTEQNCQPKEEDSVLESRYLGHLNDGFLYDMRRFLKGDGNMIDTFLFLMRNNSTTAGIINYIAKWDGFRLADLVSYDRKHNEPNGEDNQDGTDYNCSWNCGIEGKSRKKNIQELRTRQMKNAMSLVFLSQGTPLIYSGDEFGNTQEGNNNPYCQDNATGWIKWNQTESGKELFDYTKMLIALRKAHPILHSATPLRAMDTLSCGYPDISFHGKAAWRPDTSPANRTIGILYCGYYGKIDGTQDDTLLYIGVNMHWEYRYLGLPQPPKGKMWEKLSSTFQSNGDEMITAENPLEIRISPRTVEIYTLTDCPVQRSAKQKRKGSKRPDVRK